MTVPAEGMPRGTEEGPAVGAVRADAPVGNRGSNARRRPDHRLLVLVVGLLSSLAVLGALALLVVGTGEMKEVQRQQNEAARVALSLAVNQLHAVAVRNAPFAAELAVVRAVAGSDPVIAGDVTVLEPLQHDGLPPLKRIVGDFEQAAASVLIAERAGPQPGWLGQMVGRVSAITVALGMELGWNPLGSEVAPIISAAADALRNGDLSGAVRRIDALPNEALVTFEPWRDLVRRRVDAIGAINRLVLRTSTERVASRADGDRR